MTDYLTQCNAITAEKKVWRWAKYTHKSGSPVSLEREDVWRSIRFWSHDPEDYTRTEYDGDEYGNPIQAMQPPRKPKKYHIGADAAGWHVYNNDNEKVLSFRDGDAGHREAVIALERFNAIAEANRIAGGGE